MSDRDDYAAFENWAVYSTGARPYGYWNVLRDAERTGSPKWCKPHGCFGDTDKRRQHRNRGLSEASYEMRDADFTVDRADRDQTHQLSGLQSDSPEAGHWTGGSLWDLHMESNGGTGLTAKGQSGWTTGYHVARDNFGRELRVSNPRQLEVCRHCGAELGLTKDDMGVPIRAPGGQDEYCSDRCEADADNRRDRQRRAGGKFPKDDRNWYRGSTKFDLDSITVAGIGRLCIQPEGWNRVRGTRQLDRWLVLRQDGIKLAAQGKVHRWSRSKYVPADVHVRLDYADPTGRQATNSADQRRGWAADSDNVWKVTRRYGAPAASR